MGFNSAFKGLTNDLSVRATACNAWLRPNDHGHRQTL